MSVWCHLFDGLNSKKNRFWEFGEKLQGRRTQPTCLQIDFWLGFVRAAQQIPHAGVFLVGKNEFSLAFRELEVRKNDSVRSIQLAQVVGLDDFVDEIGNSEHKRLVDEPALCVCKAPSAAMRVDFDAVQCVCHVI